jgi:hypothetical protein
MKKYLLICFLLFFLFGTLPLLAQDSANVTFQINMRVKILEGYFTPASEVVTVPGDFDNWLNEPPANDTKTLSDPDGDSIYTKIIRMPANLTYNYKYAVGLTWGKDESTGNRSFTLGATDTTLPVVYFNNDEIVTPPVLDSINVTFQVNMKVKIKESFFNPDSDVVTLPGGFDNWLNEPPANDTKQMSDPDVDSIYTKTIRMPASTTYEYKYCIGLTWSGKEESANRSFAGGISDTTLPVIYYMDDSVVTLVGNGNIMFQVNMSVMTEVGIYNPNTDTVHIRGSFNGWSSSDPTKSHLNQDFIDPNLWFLDVPFTNVGINETQYYKYFVILQTPGLWTDGYERPSSRGGGNREVAFLAQPNQLAPDAYFDDIHPDWVIETSKNLQANFRVDMRPAMDPIQQAIPFNPLQDTLYWISEQPTFVRTQNWADSDTLKVLMLTDPNHDSIYTGTLSIATPSFNSFMYRYAYKAADGTWYFEPSGFSAFAYRVRYIGQDVARSFPVNPWTFPVDTWTNKEIKPDQESDPYTSLNGVRDEHLTATEYQLYQNYPNPFNPSTTIRFSIVNKSPVMLKVYNLLGQEVTTLVDEVLNPGVYKINFDGSKLASGLYFYRITANNFTLTKKMMFVK